MSITVTCVMAVRAWADPMDPGTNETRASRLQCRVRLTGLSMLRRRGVSVLIVHHAGKGGEQRGTSRREDVLDTSISLRRPSDYLPTEGARFEVHY